MITEVQLIAAIRQIAARAPHRVYNTGGSASNCSYLPNELNSCGCIVGEGLIELGIERALLDVIDQELAPIGPVGWGSDPVIDVLSNSVRPDALNSEWVSQVQAGQDSRLPWGAAVAAADRMFPQAGA